MPYDIRLTQPVFELPALDAPLTATWEHMRPCILRYVGPARIIHYVVYPTCNGDMRDPQNGFVLWRIEQDPPGVGQGRRSGHFENYANLDRYYKFVRHLGEDEFVAFSGGPPF